MQAMVLHRIGQPLEFETLADPEPGPHEIRLRVGACGVCRTDLHVVDGELPDVRPPIIPGHEIIGRVNHEMLTLARALGAALRRLGDAPELTRSEFRMDRAGA